MTAKILVVDDDDDIREILSLVLESSGFDVASARDGCEALTWLSGTPEPSVVLLDLMMPRMDGEQLLTQLRAEGSTVPVVILSGDPAGAAKAGRLRAEGFLQKPVDLDQLLDVVEALAQARA